MDFDSSKRLASSCGAGGPRLGGGFFSYCSGRGTDRGATGFQQPGRNEEDAVSGAQSRKEDVTNGKTEELQNADFRKTSNEGFIMKRVLVLLLTISAGGTYLSSPMSACGGRREGD